jgi:hypothetical protein
MVYRIATISPRDEESPIHVEREIACKN